MDELLKAYESRIELLRLIPSDGGRFELTVNDQLVYSKLQTGRHIEEGEATRVVKGFLEK